MQKISKKLFLILLFLIMIIFFIIYEIGLCSDVIFSWDYVTNITIDGFYLYQRSYNEIYDYNQPVSELIEPDKRSYIQKDISPGLKYWVLKAKAGKIYSDNSNEVSYVLPLVSPSNFQTNGLLSSDKVNILFLDGSSLNNMIVIAFDYESNLWQFRYSGSTAKDFFVPATSLKAIIRIN